MKNAKQAAFLAAYAEVGNISAAAQLAGIARTTHHKWLEDPEYSEAFAGAHEEAVDHLESEARRRALEGIQEPVIYQGELSYIKDVKGRKRRPLTVRKFSDTLLIFLLKGARPEKYRDNARVEMSGPGGGPIRGKVDLTNLTDEQLVTLESIARAAAGSGLDRGGEDPPVTPEDRPLLPGDGSVPQGTVPETP